ncbi:MAG: hypothetical protein QF473_32630, partial [Planctomycetota bacterium]|nr:hypothetical protein [Planctomycetota bacterium]
SEGSGGKIVWKLVHMRESVCFWPETRHRCSGRQQSSNCETVSGNARCTVESSADNWAIKGRRIILCTMAETLA